MTRSLRSFASAALAACALMASAMAHAFSDPLPVLRRAARKVAEFAIDSAMFVVRLVTPATPMESRDGERLPSVRRLAAKLYQLRPMKRERVTITDRYRMCPST